MAIYEIQYAERGHPNRAEREAILCSAGSLDAAMAVAHREAKERDIWHVRRVTVGELANGGYPTISVIVFPAIICCALLIDRVSTGRGLAGISVMAVIGATVFVIAIAYQIQRYWRAMRSESYQLALVAELVHRDDQARESVILRAAAFSMMFAVMVLCT